MIKDIIIAVVLLLPCLLVFNESYTIIPNLVGLAYMLLLVILSKTKVGKAFSKRIERINDKLLKDWIMFAVLVFLALLMEVVNDACKGNRR